MNNEQTAFISNVYCLSSSIVFMFCFSISVLPAQTYSVGLAGVYGDDINSLGINTRAYINLNNHKFCVGPEFTWFFRETTQRDGQVLERDLFEINLNGHYVMELTHALGLYALTGLNFSREEERYLHNGQVEEEETIEEFGGIIDNFVFPSQLEKVM